MFKRILLPLPSEYIPKNAINRAIDIAAKFKSNLTLEYIFNQEVMDKVNDVSSGAVAQCSLDMMAREVKNVEVGEESTVIFEKIEKKARKRNIKVRKMIHDGHHSDEIMDCIQKENIDLMITEFHKDAVFNYEIFYDSPIPIWLEQTGENIDKIFGILTNISPNKLVPGFAFKFSKKMDVPLQFIYVLDDEEPYDETIEEKNRHKLLSRLKKDASALNLDCEIDYKKQDVSTFLNQEFRDKKNALVILGRFSKPVKLPFTKLDKKIEVSKKLNANVLMLK